MLYFNQIPNLTRNTEILGILSKIEGCLNGIVVPTADIGKHFLLLLEAAAAAMRSKSAWFAWFRAPPSCFSARGDTKAKQRQV